MIIKSPRRWSFILSLAGLGTGCVSDSIVDDCGTSESDDSDSSELGDGGEAGHSSISSLVGLAVPRVVENTCEIHESSLSLVRLRWGTCEGLAEELDVSTRELERGFCEVSLPTSYDAWPDSVDVVEPLCNNVTVQGTMNCSPDLPISFMTGIGQQFARVAQVAVATSISARVDMAIIDTGSCNPENGTGHACTVEHAVIWGTGTAPGETPQHLTVRHFQALSENGVGSVVQLRDALDAAIVEFGDGSRVWLLELALGFPGRPGDPGVDLIRATLERAWRTGAVAVAASGNRVGLSCESARTGMLYPAAFASEESEDDEDAPLVLAVGGIDVDGLALDTALPGGIPPLVAPGVSLREVATNECLAGSGSSVASGYVAGALALALAVEPEVDRCALYQALFGDGVGDMQEDALELHICGDRYTGRRLLDVRAMLKRLGVVFDADELSGTGDVLAMARAIVESVSGARQALLKFGCDENDWGPSRVDFDYSEDCSESGSGSLGLAWPSGQGVTKGCAACKPFNGDEDGQIQVVIHPDGSALLEEFLSPGESLLASIVLKWVADGATMLGVSDTVAIEARREADGSGWIEVGGNPMSLRSVFVTQTPEGVDADDVSVWLRYDVHTDAGDALPSRWESLGHIIAGVAGLAEEDFYTGSCQSPLDPCMNLKLCEPDQRPGVRVPWYPKPFP